ncbi:PREDICTED: troponin I-like [Vollenhovia emeryi]|uniref:troponin I-like n=1 Tax=Vollenhovia emeryi TaxID=411798 RepID=UPI0005F3F25B|nr:PREDICTED: troponin I-like [Vollenhovia emeryi]
MEDDGEGENRKGKEKGGMGGEQKDVDTYESGVAKVKQAENRSDVDSSDTENNKKNRQNRAKRNYSDDEYEDDLHCMLPPPPKKPALLTKKSSEYLSKNPSIRERSTLSNEASSSQQKEKYDSVDILLSSSPCSSKEKVTSFDNATELVQNISKGPFESETLNVDTFSLIPKITEFMKEILRRCNKIDSKLDRIDGRSIIIEEKIQSGSNDIRNEHFDVEDFVNLPLKTIDDMANLELELQDANFFNKTVRLLIRKRRRTNLSPIYIL